MYTDSHAHFDLALEEPGITEPMLMENARENGISRAVQIAIDIGSSRWSRDFAARHASDGILFTSGIHPSSPAGEEELRKLEEFAIESLAGDSGDLFFGIGECGLDFYRMRQSREIQERSFRFQIGLAARLGLPVIVHSRDAMDETLAVLRESRPAAGIMHCFPGDRNAAKKVLDLGFHISFAGNVTYRTATILQDSASYVPLDRLLVETDTPFLTPAPLRGRKNLPGYIVHTYRFIAELRGEPLDRIALAVRENFTEIAKHEVKKIQV